MSEPTKGVLLVVDDEPLKRVTLQIELSEAGYSVAEAPDAATAMQQLRARPVDVVITDVRMPGMDGLQFLRQIKAASPKTQVILMTAFGSIDLAIEAMKRGAYDFLTKPFKTDMLVEKLERLRSSSEWPNVQTQEVTVARLGPLVGRSYAARQLIEQIRTVADTDRSILIEGETGCGAELVAKAIHDQSRRAGKPLMRVNCAAFSPHLLDADLFGPTSVPTAQPAGGRLQAAQGGTLFLEEIDTLPLELQAKLLRILEKQDQDPAGQAGGADVRILCATHKDLRQQVDSGKFRQDLYYRIAAVSLLVPPLRDRREDIPLLAEEFLAAHSGNGRNVPTRLSVHASEALMSYHWPGNLLELEHTMERATTLAAGTTVELKDILLPKPTAQGQGEV